LVVPSPCENSFVEIRSGKFRKPPKPGGYAPSTVLEPEQPQTDESPLSALLKKRPKKADLFSMIYSDH
jgi:hypothetical protein